MNLKKKDGGGKEVNGKEKVNCPDPAGRRIDERISSESKKKTEKRERKRTRKKS